MARLQQAQERQAAQIGFQPGVEERDTSTRRASLHDDTPTSSPINLPPEIQSGGNEDYSLPTQVDGETTQVDKPQEELQEQAQELPLFTTPSFPRTSLADLSSLKKKRRTVL